MTIKELTCIGCPLGCRISVETAGEKILAISGNSCARGEKYAENEITAPVRTVTSTVPVVNGNEKRVPVKTETNIPKNLINGIMKEIRKCTVTAPVSAGDIVIKNVLGTGVNIIASKTVEAV